MFYFYIIALEYRTSRSDTLRKIYLHYTLYNLFKYRDSLLNWRFILYMLIHCCYGRTKYRIIVQ